MGTIDEKTKVPLFAVSAVIVVLAGVIAYITTVANDAAAAKNEVAGLRGMIQQMQNDLTEVKLSVSRIEQYQQDHQ